MYMNYDIMFLEKTPSCQKKQEGVSGVERLALYRENQPAMVPIIAPLSKTRFSPRIYREHSYTGL